MRGRWYAAGGVLAVLLVGACSHSSGNDSARAQLEAGGNAGGAVAPAGAPAAASRANGAYDATGQAAGVLTRGGAHLPAGSNATPLFDSGYKIRTARMTVAIKGAKNVAAKADTAGNIAVGAGGEIDSDNRTTGPNATASLLLRVPPETLDSTLDELSNLGIEKSRTSSTTDVTQKVADVSSRVRSAQESIARLRVLFSHATKIGSIIQLESELNQREADLESLQAQQRSLARQTSLATITLSLVTAVPPVASKPAAEDHDNSFVTGLKNGWHGFSAGAAWVAKAVATLLPFIVLLIVLGFGLRLVWPRLPRRTAPPAPAPSE